MILDCHTHLNRYEDESKPAFPERIGALCAEMKKNRVDVAMVLTSYKESPGRPSLKDTVNALRDESHIFVIAGMSYLKRSEWDLGELREYLTEKKVRGIKFYCGYEPFYPNESEMWPLVDLAKEFNVPVFVHTGDTYAPRGKLKYAHPIHIDEFAVDHPDAKIIICHLGNPWVKDTMEIVYKNANVYTDISGLVLGNFNDRFEKYMISQINEMLAFGMEPSKVLYGTDWPISSMSSYLDFVKNLAIPPESRRKILWENAAKIFKIDESLIRYR